MGGGLIGTLNLYRFAADGGLVYRKRIALEEPRSLVVDLKAGVLVDRIEIAYDKAPDFPAIDPCLAGLPYEHFWMLGISKTGLLGRKFFDEVVHCSWSRPDHAETWQAPPGCYLGGEPAMTRFDNSVLPWFGLPRLLPSR